MRSQQKLVDHSPRAIGGEPNPGSERTKYRSSRKPARPGQERPFPLTRYYGDSIHCSWAKLPSEDWRSIAWILRHSPQSPLLRARQSQSHGGFWPSAPPQPVQSEHTATHPRLDLPRELRCEFSHTHARTHLKSPNLRQYFIYLVTLKTLLYWAPSLFLFEHAKIVASMSLCHCLSYTIKCCIFLSHNSQGLFSLSSLLPALIPAPSLYLNMEGGFP